MADVELTDIQGIVLRGYGAFPVSLFALLKVTDAAAARGWLAGLAPAACSAADIDRLPKGVVPDPVFNVAFTCPGLRAIGLRDANMAGFSNEFREGMVTPHRQRLLGDFGPSDPTTWRWGGPNTDPVHAMLLLYAPDERSMEDAWERHRQRFAAAGVECVGRLDGTTLEGRREHFGFRDGIGQPAVKGVDAGGPENNRVALGEFVLGYGNEYGVFPDSPRVTDGQGRPELLAQSADLGHNGSYLVFRQLSQDVHGFWSFVRSNAPDQAAAVKLASKMVGRWPSGASIAVHPNADPGAQSDDENDNFAYRAADPHGERCPIGAHVRRTNPRDGLLDSSGSQSSEIANHHRIIRRGRAYGAPPVPSMDPAGLMAAPAPDHEVGLHFLCFNANIANQFQFIQFNWAGSAKFERFYNDPDPLIGVREGGTPSVFTMPATPVRKVVEGLKRFVEVRGGAYLFLPGKRALQFLASI
jgi:Dyp-type peroxidase family